MIKKLVYIMLILVIMSCGKDDENTTSQLLENESISGTVSFEDGQPCCTDMTVSVIKSTVDNPTPVVLSTVAVSSDGAFMFDNVLPEQEDLYIILNENLPLLSAKDDTPDGDELEGDLPGVIWIGVYLDTGEHDDGNNFVISVQECTVSFILGHVYSVIGEDTTDLAEEVVINLFSSDDGGNLIDLLESESTNGAFSFQVDNELTATLEIDYSGLMVQPIAFSLIDESPDDDPTFGLEITHLPVHVDSCEVDSDNNIYIFFDENSSECDAMPTILPYPALCDTSILCSYDELPVFVIDEFGNPIVTAGGIYQMEWTDLVTGEIQLGSWIFVETNHPVQVKITYPDGCIYTIFYQRDCEQDLYGEFSMRVMTTGLGPTYEYEVGEVEWSFDPFGGTILIEHNITNPATNPNLIPAGNYNYSIIESMNGLEMNIENSTNGMTYGVGEISFANGQILFDDDIPADGPGRFFEKN